MACVESLKKTTQERSTSDTVRKALLVDCERTQAKACGLSPYSNNTGLRSDTKVTQLAFSLVESASMPAVAATSRQSTGNAEALRGVQSIAVDQTAFLPETVKGQADGIWQTQAESTV